MVVNFTSILADFKLNILTMTNKSRGDVAYTVLDIDSSINDEVLDTISKTEGVYLVRSI